MPRLVKKIIRSHDPYRRKVVEESHRKADKLEKQKYPKGYKILKHLGNSLGKHELLGEHTSKGKIEISKKVPKAQRKEVAFHERIEYREELKRGMYRRKK
jgi:hypothetical protein